MKDKKSLTVQLDADLLRSVKIEAAKQGISLKNIIETFLKLFVSEKRK